MPLPALIPIALSVLPELARWAFGKDASDATSRITTTVGAVLGTTDPTEVQAALQDPIKAAQLKTELVKIDSDFKLEMFRLEIQSAADARAMAGKSTLIARAQVTFGAVIIGIVAATVIAPLFSYRQIEINPFIAATFGAVVQFFFGNSTSANAANTVTASVMNRVGNMMGYNRPQQNVSAPLADTVYVNPNGGTTTNDANELEWGRIAGG